MSPIATTALVLAHGLIGPGAPPLEWGLSPFVRFRVELMTPSPLACADAAGATAGLIIASALRSRSAGSAPSASWRTWLSVLPLAVVLFVPSHVSLGTAAALAAAMASVPLARGAARVEAGVWAAVSVAALWVGGCCLETLRALRSHPYAGSPALRGELLPLRGPAPPAAPLSVIAVLFAVLLVVVVVHQAAREGWRLHARTRSSLAAAGSYAIVLALVVALGRMAAAVEEAKDLFW